MPHNGAFLTTNIMLKQSLKQSLQVAVELDEFTIANKLIEILNGYNEKPNQIRPAIVKQETTNNIVAVAPVVVKHQLPYNRRMSDYREALLDYFTSDRFMTGTLKSPELYECLKREFSQRWSDFPTAHEDEKLKAGCARWVSCVSQIINSDEQIKQLYRKPYGQTQTYIFHK